MSKISPCYRMNFGGKCRVSWATFQADSSWGWKVFNIIFFWTVWSSTYALYSSTRLIRCIQWKLELLNDQLVYFTIVLTFFVVNSVIWRRAKIGSILFGSGTVPTFLSVELYIVSTGGGTPVGLCNSLAKWRQSSFLKDFYRSSLFIRTVALRTRLRPFAIDYWP